MTDQNSFQKLVWDYYRDQGRHDLPWRLPNKQGEFDPYCIMVSEIMLQQTQVARVVPKYQKFLEAFPNVETLARAPLADVLKLWNGLGYNRRAKFLWQAAGFVARKHNGKMPDTLTELISLPGIGPNTAGAILAYAFNRPVVFIETNIRTVFIHHFLSDQSGVDDRTLLPIIQEALPQDAPREWYWALMDYGTHIKQTVGNVSRASKTYTKQSTFQGSRRQIRGQVLRTLIAGPMTAADLTRQINDERLLEVLQSLTSEGLIAAFDGTYALSA
ncbi:MAG TPA: hypothetical protein VF733_06360 [Candidatus Saccharimonadales bacterium]